MYQPRTANYDKRDPVKRCNLPDRVFFACGACHILAYAWLQRFARYDTTALWIKPAQGYTGNHIVVATPNWIFDYHGYARRKDYFDHCLRRARQRCPGWDASLITLPQDVLISEEESRQYDGLWLRQPDQFLHNALPRAERFLDRFDHRRNVR